MAACAAATAVVTGSVPLPGLTGLGFLVFLLAEVFAVCDGVF